MLGICNTPLLCGFGGAAKMGRKCVREKYPNGTEILQNPPPPLRLRGGCEDAFIH